MRVVSVTKPDYGRERSVNIAVCHAGEQTISANVEDDCHLLKNNIYLVILHLCHVTYEINTLYPMCLGGLLWKQTQFSPRLLVPGQKAAV